jgi:phosphosulfolactate phosphohydrolase-like enzyme
MTSTETSGTEGAIRVRRLRPKDLCSQRADTIVVIDVLRMTSTAAVLMKRPSCTNLVVAATLEEVHRLAQPISGYVLVSELVGPSWPGIWVDNSPARVSCLEFGERTPVLLTSNGTNRASKMISARMHWR